MADSKKVFGLLLLLLVAISILILVPLGKIWALNTLFDAGIEYTLKNWFAAAFFK